MRLWRKIGQCHNQNGPSRYATARAHYSNDNAVHFSWEILEDKIKSHPFSLPIRCTDHSFTELATELKRDFSSNSKWRSTVHSLLQNTFKKSNLQPVLQERCYIVQFVLEGYFICVCPETWLWFLCGLALISMFFSPQVIFIRAFSKGLMGFWNLAESFWVGYLTEWQDSPAWVP